MRAYIYAKTNIPDLIVDYVDLEDNDGRVYNFNPNGSSGWDLEDSDYSAEWRGVDIGEKDASGCLGWLPDGLKIACVGASYDLSIENPYIREMEFVIEEYDNGLKSKSYSIADVMPAVDHT